MSILNRLFKFRVFQVSVNILLSGFLALVVLAGFYIKPAFAEKPRASLVVWAMGAEGIKIGEMARIFEKENPDVKVVTQAIPWAAAHEKLITAIAGNNTPDISQLGTTWIPEFVSIEALAEVNTFVEGPSSIKPEIYFSSSWKTNIIDGKIYGIPWYVDTRVLFYRTDLLKEAGYDHAPRTWEELEDVSKKLTKDIDNDGRIDRYAMNLPARDWGLLSMFIWQNGGDILDSTYKTCVLDSPQAKVAVDFYLSFFKNGYAPLETAGGIDVFNAFRTGYFSMFVSGPWMVEDVHNQIPEIEGKWSVAPLPRKITGSSFVGGSSLVIFKQSKNKALAWKFLEFMSRPDIQAIWYEKTKDLPSVKATWELDVLRSNAKMAVFGEQLKDTVTPPPIPEWEHIGDIISKNMESFVYKKIDSDKFIKETSEEITTLIQYKRPEQSKWFKLGVLGFLVVLVVTAFILYVKLGPKDVGLPREINNVKDFLKEVFLFPAPYFFILPSVVLFMIFLFSPIFLSFIMSMTNWDITCLNNTSNISFIGISNYIKLFHDPLFWKALGNTFIFVLVGAPISIMLSLLAAIALNSQLVKFRTIFRVGYFAPVVTTMVAVAIVWRWLYNPQFGLINNFLSMFGIGQINWLSDSRFAMPALIIMAAWKNFGYNMVIFLAGLQGIPQQLYEAAEIDGASGTGKFFNITVPLLKPVIFFITIMSTIGYFQFFDEPYIMTDGGPLNSTLSIVLFMYREGFKYFQLGYASSIAYVLFGIIAAFSVIQLKFSKTNFEY